MPHAVVVTVREEGRPPCRGQLSNRAVSSLDSRSYGDSSIPSRIVNASSRRRVVAVVVIVNVNHRVERRSVNSRPVLHSYPVLS